MRRFGFCAALCALAFCCAMLPATGARAALPLVNLFSFGDSLSDGGNVYLYSGYTLPDAGQYWQGRFSNGPVWTDRLAAHMGMANDYLVQNFLGLPPVPPPAPPYLYLNAAYGGAVTGPNTNSFLTQVQMMVDAGAIIPADTLITIWIGGNDLRSLYGVPTELLPVAIPAMIANVANGTAQGMTTLADSLGATHFAVMYFMDFGAFPGFSGDPALAAQVRALSVGFNNAISSALDGFEAAHPGVTVYRIDTMALYDKILAAPGKYGIVDTTTQGLTEGLTFEQADGFLWWDGIHPAASAHALIGAQVFGGIFIDAPDANVDYMPVSYSGDTVVGVAAQQGTVTSLAFLDPAATAEADRPTDLTYGILRTGVALSGADTAVFTLYFAEALPASYGIFKYTGSEWVDFADVYASTGGAQGAEISGDRRSVTVRVLDNGVYDQDPAAGHVIDPIAPGVASAPAPELPPCFFGSLWR